MTGMLALELNDLGLAVAGELSPGDLPPSPGWAVFEPNGNRIRVGAEAADRIRLNPRLAHRRIWSELDLTPLPRPYPRGLSTADLAYAHLRSVWDEVDLRLGRRAGEVEGRLLLAPGSFSVEQLGLVLGIAESLELPFTGVVDSAVAAASTLAPRPYVVLDLELGRTVATEIEVSERDGGDQVVRRRVRSQQGAGWNALIDAWARTIGRAFVTTTRFDPLHNAASEQALYTALPEWLAALVASDSAEASMHAGDREHGIVLKRQEIADAAETVYSRVVELGRSLGSRGATLAVTDRLRRAPGLLERLVAAGFAEPELLPPGAALDGALASAGLIHEPSEVAPRWVTELPARDPSGAAAPESAASTVR